MGNDTEIIPYDKEKYQLGDYKAFSYAVVWFLDDNNKPLSELPFRLKLSGYAGITFVKNYSYYSNPNSFCQQFLQTYKELTGDKAVEKNNIFYAHAIYSPQLTRSKVTSSVNGKSSFAIQTEGFTAPNVNNFASLIIKNNTETSNRIKELVELSKSWVRFVAAEPDEVQQVQAQLEPAVDRYDSPFDAGLEPATEAIRKGDLIPL